MSMLRTVSAVNVNEAIELLKTGQCQASVAVVLR